MSLTYLSCSNFSKLGSLRKIVANFKKSCYILKSFRVNGLNHSSIKALNFLLRQAILKTPVVGKEAGKKFLARLMVSSSISTCSYFSLSHTFISYLNSFADVLKCRNSVVISIALSKTFLTSRDSVSI